MLDILKYRGTIFLMMIEEEESVSRRLSKQHQRNNYYSYKIIHPAYLHKLVRFVDFEGSTIRHPGNNELSPGFFHLLEHFAVTYIRRKEERIGKHIMMCCVMCVV
jgi:hypothetical protein